MKSFILRVRLNYLQKTPRLKRKTEPSLDLVVANLKYAKTVKTASIRFLGC